MKARGATNSRSSRRAKGNVRRNALSDFANVIATGKIAMKFEGEDADDRLIAVAVCGENDDFLLATRNGRSIRFPAADVRVFSSRSSVGVRGIRLARRRCGDLDVDLAPRRCADARSAMRFCVSTPSAGAPSRKRSRTAPLRKVRTKVAAQISEEQYQDLAARAGIRARAHRERLRQAQLGLRLSDHRPRRAGPREQRSEPRPRRDDRRLSGRSRAIRSCSSPISAQLIRVPVDDISIRRRRSGGVTVFKVDDGERVVSVARLPEDEAERCR